MRTWVHLAWGTPLLLILLALALAASPFLLLRVSAVRHWALDRSGALSFLAGDQRLRIDTVARLDPYGLHIRGVRVEVRDPHDGSDWRTWARLAELDVAWSPSDLLGRRIHVSRLLLSGLDVDLDSLPDPVLAPSPAKERNAMVPLQIPAVQCPSLSAREIVLRRGGQPVYEAGVDMADLHHQDRHVSGRLVHLAVIDWPDSLKLFLSDGRLRGRLVQSLHLDSLRISGPGLDGDLRGTWSRDGGRDDPEAKAELLLRMDRIVPHRIPPLRRLDLPLHPADSLAGHVALDAVFGTDERRVLMADLDLHGRLFGTPLDTLVAGFMAQPDTVHLSSLRVRYGGMHASGEAAWAPGRAWTRFNFSGVDLSRHPVSLAAEGLPGSSLSGRVVAFAGPLDAGAVIGAEIHLDGGRLADGFVTPLFARVSVDPQEVRAWIHQPPDSAISSLAGNLVLDRESGVIDARGSLHGGRLEELLAPWAGIEAGGRAYGPFHIRGGGPGVIRIEADLGFRDVMVEGVTIDTLRLSSVSGTVDPLLLQAGLGGRGLDAYGVMIDSLAGRIQVDDTIRAAFTAWRDTIAIGLRARIHASDPGIVIFDSLRVEPGAAPAWDVSIRPGLVFGSREVRVDTLRARSDAVMVEASGFLQPRPGHPGTEPFAFRVRATDLDFGRVADYLELDRVGFSGFGGFDAEGSGTLGSPLFSLNLSMSGAETMDWIWESIDLSATAGEGIGVRMDSLRASGRGYFGLLPGMEQMGPQPIGAPVKVRVDSLRLTPDRPWSMALAVLPDSIWDLLRRSSIGGSFEISRVPVAPLLSPVLAPRTQRGPTTGFAEPLDPMVGLIRVERPSAIREAERRPSGIAGRLSMSGAITGTGSAPSLELEARGDGIRIHQAWADSVLLHVSYADSLLRVHTLDWHSGGQRSRTQGSVPLYLVLDPGEVRLLPDSVDLRTELPDVDLSLASLVTSLIQDPQGSLSGNVRIEGVPPNLHAAGGLQVREGAFRIPGREDRVSRLDADLMLGRGGIEIVRATGRLNETGRLEVHGIYLDEDHFGLRASVRDAPVFETGSYRFTVDGDFLAQPVMEGDSLRPTVSGRVRVREGLITMDLAKQAPAGPPPYTPWIVELEVSAPGNLRVHQPTASVDLGEAELLVSFRWPHVSLGGSVQVLDGHYRVFNRSFRVTGGSVEFEDTGTGPHPVLEVQAMTQIPGPEDEGPVQIRIDVSGTPEQLDVVLSSPNRPDYSQEQLIELLSVGQLGSPEFGRFSAGDPTRQYLEAELMSQVERQLIQQLPWVSRVQITGGLSAAEPVRINVRPIVQPQWSLNYSQELTSDPWREVSLNYRLSNLLFLNAAMDRREMEDRLPQETYSLDLKLRIEY